MSEEKKEEQAAPHNETTDQQEVSTEETVPAETEAGKEEDEKPASEDPVELLKQEVDTLNDKYTRLYSEFENYRRRTARERIELIKSAGEEVFVALLPVLDDFERALASMKEAKDIKAVEEGVRLIHQKLNGILENKGLKKMESVGETFDVERHEAISNMEAPDKKMKGKVIEEVEKGYLLNDKVIRYAKVVIGN